MPKVTNEQIHTTLKQHTKLLTQHSKLFFKLEQKIDTLNERTRSYPKLYDNVDKLVGEILENRQERTLLHQKIQNHERRLLGLEART